jgi:hypothetical protein
VKRLIEIISLIIIAFILSSLWLYRHRLGQATLPSPSAQDSRDANIDLGMAEGEISTFDTDNRTLILTDGNNSLTVSLDDKTTIFESGHPIRFTAISSGAKAKVRYRKKSGRYWAVQIELLPGNSY